MVTDTVIIVEVLVAILLTIAEDIVIIRRYRTWHGIYFTLRTINTRWCAVFAAAVITAAIMNVFTQPIFTITNC